MKRKLSTSAMRQALKLKKLESELKSLKREVAHLKKNLFDPDTIMSADDMRAHKQAMKELREGKLIPYSKLRKELGLDA